jgi:hypothetical protein
MTAEPMTIPTWSFGLAFLAININGPPLMMLGGQALNPTPPNCRPLTHFHMARCDNGSGEFGEDEKYERWPRPDREALAGKFRRIINASMLSGFAIGVSRKHWDGLITGDRHRILGDAEGWAIRQVIHFGIRWATSRECECDPDLAMFFDKRRMGEVCAVHKTFDSEPINLLHNASYAPNLLPVGFSVMSKTHPIQAADLFAWEFYQNVNDILKGSDDQPQREQMRELILEAKGRLPGAIVGETEIKALLESSGSDEYFAKLIDILPKSWNWKVK